ncbi:hypothetical protein CgunFtcFv8_020090 [Champsocephalus gunnari]|uniref:Uncharacterized protein n=1 Tax=Champsocephalus gunnari TaxID=52237 RepID=A0AAN8DID5_CHAGU|nr:hypothetical protein CgunFtcFv8_020090 [Champsocephalus gunnari]
MRRRASCRHTSAPPRPTRSCVSLQTHLCSTTPHPELRQPADTPLLHHAPPGAASACRHTSAPPRPTRSCVGLQTHLCSTTPHPELRPAQREAQGLEQEVCVLLEMEY